MLATLEELVSQQTLNWPILRAEPDPGLCEGDPGAAGWEDTLSREPVGFKSIHRGWAPYTGHVGPGSSGAIGSDPARTH